MQDNPFNYCVDPSSFDLKFVRITNAKNIHCHNLENGLGSILKNYAKSLCQRIGKMNSVKRIRGVINENFLKDLKELKEEYKFD